MAVQTYDPDSDKKFEPGELNSAEQAAAEPTVPTDARGLTSPDVAGAENRAANDKFGSTAGEVNDGGVASDDQVGSGFTGDGSSKRKGRFWTKKKVKAAGLGTGIVVGGSMFGLSIISGPMEFIHLAQVLHGAHFSNQENAGDGRMSKMYRFLRSKGHVGETRMGFLASNYHGKIINKLSDIGIVPEYNNKLDTYKGFTLDTEHANSPYKGMTPQQAAAAFEQKTGFKPTINGNKITVDAKGFWSQRKSLSAALSELGDAKLTTAVRVRVLGKFGLVTWHPLKIVDKKVNNSAVKIANSLKDKWKERLKSGVEPPVTLDGARGQNTDANGNPIPLTPEEQASASSSVKDSGKVKSTLDKLANSKGAGIAGGVAAAAGVACALKAVNDSVPEIRYAQVIVPLTRMGMNAITVGYQIMSGQDVDPAELSYLSQSFSHMNDNGTVDTWDQSLPIRAETGQKGGTDISSGTKDLITKNSISWLSWTNNLGAICSGVGQAITGVVSIGLGIISGGTVSTISGFIAGAALTGPLIQKAAEFLAGDAVNVLASGAEWGSNVDYGARLGANAAALQFGGTALTSSQSAELTTQSNAIDQANFKSKSLASRLFDPYDSRSMLAHAIDSQSPNMSQNIASLTSRFMNIGSSIIRLPAAIFPHAQAVTSTAYDYGFPEIGFSAADLNNAAVENPYDNADAVATLLDGPNGATYITKAQACFGVGIGKGADGLWDVTPQKDVDIYSAKYDQGGCTSSGDANWLKIRFFIFDTGIMEGYACAQLDDAQSCANDGIGAAAANTVAQTTASDISAYKNPFRDIKSPLPNRIDQGVDYGGAGGPVYAIGNGTVLHTADSGWYGWFIVYQLSDGPAKGKFVFVAEGCPALVHIGQTVTSNTVLCNMEPGGYSLEIGWAQDPKNGGVAMAKSEYTSQGLATSFGKNFSQLLQKLGAAPGIISGPGGSSGESQAALPAGWPTW
ncbi:MAG: M23 family metallopeptidase [Candidatus Saccharimonadales bacterium]